MLVAVIDDGIRFDHPGIAANLTSDGYDFVANSSLVNICGVGLVGRAGDGDDFDPDPTLPFDGQFNPILGCFEPNSSGNHGLHVAGTIGAIGNDALGGSGVNWSVAIRPIRVLGIDGGNDYEIAQGLLYAAGLPADDGAGGFVQTTPGARVVNMSLGGPGTSTTLENAVIAATNAGALIIAAAGNDTTSSPFYPAAYTQTLSVSAVGPGGILAIYSNFGPTIDIAAPGGDLADGDATFEILSTAWNYVSGTAIWDASGWHGTSMAAPHVAGVAALLLAQEPGLSAAGLRARLIDYAVDVGAAGRDDLYGAGIVNARNSLTQSLEPPHQLFARLIDATSGALLQTVVAQPDGSYAFTELDDRDYLVYAGQDEDGDQQIGVPGRRWGAFGGSATPGTVTVSGAGTYDATFSIGFPIQLEPNDTFGSADILPIGGYLHGTIGASMTDADISLVQISAAGQYTFETSAVDGACGFALGEDTILQLYDVGGTLLLDNDNIDATNLDFCSRVSATLNAGTYFVVVWGWNALPYRIQARSGG